MAKMVQKGINSFKFFMAYKGALMVGDELLLDGMQRCKQLGALAMVTLLLSARFRLRGPSSTFMPSGLTQLGLGHTSMAMVLFTLVLKLQESETSLLLKQQPKYLQVMKRKQQAHSKMHLVLDYNNP